MTSSSAAQLLELPPDATPEQIEARFHELRTRLEEKIGKAPTPGLKAKYRETLEEVTQAFETLALASDSTSLPVLRREQGEGGGEKGGKTEAGDGRPEAGKLSNGGAAAPPRGSESNNPKSRIQNRKSGKEFVFVAFIAVVVLGAGGWFVLKTRAENAEKARMAAEAKAEADRLVEEEKRQAEESRLAAEAKRQAEAEEKVRLAAVEKAEQERREEMIALLRSRLAELNVTAGELLREEPARATRQLTELKSDERSLTREADAFALNKARARMDAQQAYVDMLDTLLSRHPAKLQQARATELLAARQPEQAEVALGELNASLQALELHIASARRNTELRLQGMLKVDSPHPDVTWTFTDAFGEKHGGTGSGRLERVAVGSGELVYSRPGWPVQRAAVTIRAGQPVGISTAFNSAMLQLASVPSGATFRLDSGATGKTPATLPVVPGQVALSVNLPGFQTARVSVTAVAGETTIQRVELAPTPLLSDQELARYIATLPRSNVVSDVPLATWSPQRVPVPQSVPGREVASVCLLTFRPVAMTLTQSSPAIPAASFFASAPAAPKARASSMFSGGLAGTMMRAKTVEAPVPAASLFDDDGHGHVILSGLLHRGNLTWVYRPKVELASTPALAEAANNWLAAAEFQYTGSPAPFHVLVYVVMKFHRPTY